MTPDQPDLTQISLEQWLAQTGTRTATMTINGMTFTDLNEIEWRQANNDWTTPRPNAPTYPIRAQQRSCAVVERANASGQWTGTVDVP